MTNTNGDFTSENFSNSKSFILLLKHLVSNYLENFDNTTEKKFSKQDELLQAFLKSQPSIFIDIAELCQDNPEIYLTHYSITKRDKDGTFKVQVKKKFNPNSKKGEKVNVIIFKIL